MPGTVFSYTGRGQSQSPAFTVSASPWKLRYTASWTGSISLYVIKENGETVNVAWQKVTSGVTYETFVHGRTGTLYFSAGSVPAEGEWSVAVVQ